MLNKRSNLIFWGILFFLYFLYDYHHILFLRPTSTHQWAQCDRISIARQYYDSNRSLFEPAVNNLRGDDTGQGVSELPLLQYAIAQCWKFFGVHEWFYRLLEMILLASGLYAFFLFSEMLLKSKLFSLYISFLLFSSPVLVFYGNNFLSDVPSLAFVFIGWYFFFLFKDDSQKKYFLLTALFLTVAALLKASALINLVALFGIYILELLPGVQLERQKKIFPFHIVPIICFIIGFSCVYLWYQYAHNYNLRHKSDVFLTEWRAIWNYNAKENLVTWNNYWRAQLPEFFHPYLLAALGTAFLINVFHLRKISPILFYFNIIFFCGSIALLLLFFGSYRAHDYYQIVMLVFVAFVLIGFFTVIENKYAGLLKSKTFITVLGVILIINILYAALKIKISYSYPKERKWHSYILPSYIIKQWQWYHWNYSSTIKAFEDIESYNRSIGIKPSDIVLCIPDESYNVNLYLMNQKGYTLGYVNPLTKEYLNKWLKEKNIKYIFVSDEKTKNHPDIKPFLNEKIGSYRNVDIYLVKKEEKLSITS
jgi:hypothetical protein